MGYFTMGSPQLGAKQEEGSQSESSDSESRAADSDSDYSECSDLMSPTTSPSPYVKEPDVAVGVHDVTWAQVGEDSGSVFSFVRTQNAAPMVKPRDSLGM